MGIRNSGTIIKEARLKAGLTQEQLSFGVCSLASLCNIETGKMGVSPSTFQALMKKAGTPNEAYPIFINRKDFDAFMLLKNIRLYIDKSCLTDAYNELIQLRISNYGNIRLYYKEALYLYARIKYLTYDANYDELIDILQRAITITHPNFDITDFRDEFLSFVDYEIILLMAGIYINTGRINEADSVCEQVSHTLSKSLADDKYTAAVKVLYHFTYSKELFCRKKYKEAKENSALARDLADKFYIETNKTEIIILDIINEYLAGEPLMGKDLLYMLSLASHLECGFLSDLIDLLKSLNIPDEYLEVTIPDKLKLSDFSFEVSAEALSDGSFDIFDDDLLTIGALIGVLRKEQRLSLNVLCDGLCSVSKLSKIENRKQEPSIFLAEALLNRLGYSERDFIFYGNTEESECWKQKNFLLSKHRLGDHTSKEALEIMNEGLKSSEPSMRQICQFFKSSADFSEQNCEELIEALKISIPDFTIDTIGQRRLSWNEITLLNCICTNYIRLNKYKEAAAINDALCAYAKKPFITPKYKSATLFLSIRLRFRYLYNYNRFRDIVKELDEIKEEFLLKSVGSAADFFFYSSQAYGELHDYDKMVAHARIAAGYFMMMGLTRRKDYLLSEIKRQFNVEV